MPFNWTALIPLGFLGIIGIYWLYSSVFSKFQSVRIQNWDELLAFAGLVLTILIGIILLLTVKE